MEKDVIIIGGGPAGLTAALYTSRARLNTLVIEQQAPGGQMMMTTDVENYPGFPDGITGPELGSLMEKQAKKFGAEIAWGSVQSIDAETRTVVTDNGSYRCKALILCLGASPMKLGLERESALTGRGVSYCATCDGAFFRDQVVAVIGGGNTAIEDAIFLTNFASKVYVIHRRDALRAEKCIQEKAFSNPKIEFVWNTVVTGITGEDELKSIAISNKVSGETKQLDVTGLFIFVGYQPRTGLVQGLVELDDNGYVKVDRYHRTSVPWIFSAGDCVAKAYKQIATAVGDGCTAAMSAIAHLE